MSCNDNYLCKTFRHLARKTWGEMRDAEKGGINLSEESITDYRLLDMVRIRSNEIKIIKFNKQTEEPELGADWAWFFIGGGKYIHMRVQTKILARHGNNYKYRHLLYPDQHPRQVDTLIAKAEEYDITPMYCFYNYWDYKHYRMLRPPQVCYVIGNKLTIWGCAVADAYSVREKINATPIQNCFSNIAALCHPWHCMVCSKGFNLGDGPPTLPDRVHGLLLQKAQKRINVQERQRNLPHVRDQVPPIINDLIFGEDNHTDRNMQMIRKEFTKLVGEVDAIGLVAEI